jgi:hypothetical protein
VFLDVSCAGYNLAFVCWLLNLLIPIVHSLPTLRHAATQCQHGLLSGQTGRPCGNGEELEGLLHIFCHTIAIQEHGCVALHQGLCVEGAIARSADSRSLGSPLSTKCEADFHIVHCVAHHRWYSGTLSFLSPKHSSISFFQCKIRNCSWSTNRLIPRDLHPIKVPHVLSCQIVNEGQHLVVGSAPRNYKHLCNSTPHKRPMRSHLLPSSQHKQLQARA